MMKFVTLTPTRSVSLTNPNPKHNLTPINWDIEHNELWKPNLYPNTSRNVGFLIFT